MRLGLPEAEGGRAGEERGEAVAVGSTVSLRGPCTCLQGRPRVYRWGCPKQLPWGEEVCKDSHREGVCRWVPRGAQEQPWVYRLGGEVCKASHREGICQGVPRGAQRGRLPRLKGHPLRPSSATSGAWQFPKRGVLVCRWAPRQTRQVTARTSLCSAALWLLRLPCNRWARGLAHSKVSLWVAT